MIGRRIFTRMMLLCLLLMASGVDGVRPISSTHAQSLPLEYQVKAAFLYQFSKFVEWPTNAFETSESPLVIGILGADPIADAMLSSIEGKEVRGHRVVVKQARSVEELTKHHVLFITSGSVDRMTETLRTLKGTSVLTVSEVEGFAGRGGMIGFITIENKIKFEINPGAAQRANLKISSQLLKLAKIVQEE